MITDVDVLVIGSGIAGLSFALRTAEFARVAVVTKKSDTESSTNYAQGGIAAVMDPNDSFTSHARDTHVAGAYLCHEDAVRILVHEGPARVRELIDFGVRFTQSSLSHSPFHLDLGREGGHSTRRIVHAADLTGREVERALVANVKHSHNIRVFEHLHGIDLITSRDGDKIRCVGAHVVDADTGDVVSFRAKVTMLATGGLSRIYLHTTNPEIATGDGVAMSFRAGAVIGNMEFIQFHPTTLYHADARSFLISEAVRGEGGILRLGNGETFMEDYHEMSCLAPRDIVARAIDAELKKSGDECVYLDITHLDPEKIRSHFPNIYDKCQSVGIDITKDWIPIVPAAHYSCGGVVTDTEGRTSIDRLYACGEVACTGVHGANRLASNSLLEAVVFARRASDDARIRLADTTHEPVDEYPVEKHTVEVSEVDLHELTHKLQTVMWNYVGIVRTDERLTKALAMIRQIRFDAEQLFSAGRLRPNLLELRDMALAAELVTLSALSRKESRGLNYNADHPDLDDTNFKHDTLLSVGAEGEPVVLGFNG